MVMLLNQNQLAFKLNLTKGRISQLKKEGRLEIAKVTDPISKQVKFDYHKVIEILSKNSNIYDEENKESLNFVEKDFDDNEDDDNENPINKNDTYDQARAKKMRYTAELERLEYEKLKGNLIKLEQIEAEAFECAKRIREALTNLPDRLSAQLAVISKDFEVHKLLTNEINIILTELSK